ncbi:MAG: ATP-binding cassette domain-containing protein [Vicinamibacterales bacterium]
MALFDLEIDFTQGHFSLAVSVQTQARVLALYGPSGSGKTTTLELIAGIRTPARGRIVVDGQYYFDGNAAASMPVRERRIGYVPQDVLLFPHMDVRRNVEYGWRGDATRAAMLAGLLELEPLMARQVQSLSGGERQRVALARALNASPQLLLLDEPLAAVDLARRARIIEALTRVRDELAIPIVYVAHAKEEVRALADVTIVMDGGRVVAAGPSASVLP